MEFKYIEDDVTNKEKIINEEKTVCNKPVTNQILRRSIRILKNSNCRNLRNRNVHAFVVVAKSILLTFNIFFVKMKVFTCMEVITWMKQVKKL